MLVGRPPDGLHGGLVLREVRELALVLERPDEELVVVAPAGEQLLVEGPLQAANFLLVAHVLLNGLLRTPDVVHEDVPVPGAGGQQVVVPGERADAPLVAAPLPDGLVLDDVPNFDVAEGVAHGEVLVALRPGDGADGVGVLESAEARDLGGVAAPDENGVLEAHGEDVEGRPVEEVEVEVVLEVFGF